MIQHLAKSIDYSSYHNNLSNFNNLTDITTLIILNKEMNDIIKIVQALEDSSILLKGVTKTIKNETTEQK